ncbi:MAG: signal peptidase I [Ilumatobacteraceae bacterium]
MTTTVDSPSDDETVERPGHDARTTRRVLWFAAALVAMLLVHSFVVEPVRVRSDSMEPTVPSGAVLLVDKITMRARDPRRGEIVVASDPRTGASIVKRVVAIGGDSVGIDNGQLVVNGVKIVEHYIDNDGMDGFYFGPDVVPPGHVFLLGDHRATSEDSRAFGPVDVDAIDGRLMATLWPLG